MIAARLSEIAAPLNGALQGADADFVGAGTDSRTLRAGELFIALRGPRFDGHAYAGDAAARGAAAVLVERAAQAPVPQLRVEDSRRALGRLARWWRARFELPLVAVTGSNGKTTVKEMLAAILGRAGAVLATQGNLNNDIGVPLTLFRLGPEHRHAVLEMGANHPGEIAALAGLARPAVAVNTLCAPAHLEGFGSVEGVARAKGEIFSALADDGVAVINADDAYAPLWAQLAAGRRQLRFAARDPDAEVRVIDRGADAESGKRRLLLQTPAGDIALQLALPGRHNGMNAAAAAACALALGIDPACVRDGLQQVRPMAGRLQLRRARGGGRILDDSYNANPRSLAAALDALVELPGRHWLALGDMGELGARARELHREAGELARAAGVERLFAVGELARVAAGAFGAGAAQYADAAAAAAAIGPNLTADVTLLVKGSRAAHLERLVGQVAAED